MFDVFTKFFQKEKRHKKEKKKKRDKSDKESRKRKHDEISNALPPVLEPSVSKEPKAPSPLLPVVNHTEPDKEPSSVVIQQQTEDKPPTSAG
jgi:hypothetical protein